MCGRFTETKVAKLVAEHFKAQMKFEFGERYNVAPGQKIAVVSLDKSGDRVLDGYKWGLVPSWALENSKFPKPINAKAETLTEKQMFRAAFKSRRCLIPADGFYEWQGTAKVPHFIHFADGRQFAFAGIWEEKDDMRTCAIITTEPNELMKPIHGRMPVILRDEFEEAWLDPKLDTEAALAMLRPYEDGRLEAYEVSKRVGNVVNDDAKLIEKA